MGGVSDLLIDIEEDMRAIHAESPRPTWEEAVARLMAIEHQGRHGNTFTLGDGPGDDQEGEEGENDEEDGRAWIESALESVGEQWDDDWEGDVEGDEDEKGEEEGATVSTGQTGSSAKIAVGMKRDREPTLKVIFLVEWRLTTQVGSFEDVSHIETSCGDEEEAESIVRDRLESTEQGKTDHAYRTRASAVAARDAMLEELFKRARLSVKTRLSGKVANGGPSGKIRMPLSDKEYDEMKRKEVVMEDEAVQVDGDARTTAEQKPPFGYPFDARGFAIHWGPDPEQHGQRLRRYGPYVGACEQISTEGSCTLKMIELEPEEGWQTSGLTKLG
mmetsp:Transcript_6515/g.15092  ORF Transcript_6515/g.15092 Transcript_6515/m.15092 type:complete len:331 (-) Transcript_6515:439-1431(-)|eukprot:CAMPEP_0119360068 /NCGR_PEP_ID=MMETSP1334-20130426/7787_1 /TAXON_ID=127549 /ORGANISM="Calcidiscus leptoporus, Strain RCC1130" /LENGTH=330 /DNA_ID=CAMNT_0007374843 /DNA_START=211 /DNA_END=1203 /DNA_ORIENTATION=-